MPEQRGIPRLETLTSSLVNRHMLLVLDNCEHLPDVATVTDCRLRTCPNLRILVTSREPLRAEGETAWWVPSLAEPEAVRLFQRTGARSRPEHTLTARNAFDVAEVCRRLDGLPLAIELAAARARVLSPAELAARLDDRFSVLVTGHRTAPPRHQTLHNLGFVALASGNTQSAAESFGQAIVQFRQLGDRRGIAESVVGLGGSSGS